MSRLILLTEKNQGQSATVTFVVKVITFISPITANEHHIKTSLPLWKMSLWCAVENHTLLVLTSRGLIITGTNLDLSDLSCTPEKLSSLEKQFVHSAFLYTHSNKYKSKYTILGRQRRGKE